MKPRILIVDDEKPLRDTLARWFRPKYDCLVAPDADEAMKLVAANPDLALMITDVRMPGEDGVSLLRRAKAANPDMGAIVLTAYGTVDPSCASQRPCGTPSSRRALPARRPPSRRRPGLRSSPASRRRWRRSTASYARSPRRTRQ